MKIDKGGVPCHSARMNLELFFCALGLAILMEGIFYAVCANKLPKMFLYMSCQPPSMLRKGGIAAMLLGLGLIALVRL